MDARREMLEDMLERYEKQLAGLNSYLKELEDVTAKHGTDKTQFEEDLDETEHNIEYYKSEIARIKKEIGKTPAKYDYPQTGGGAILPQTAKQSIGYLILASVSFAAGAILGSNLMSRSADDDKQKE
jgi:septal ring factor EnvC (AmiA/AmiB activator)